MSLVKWLKKKKPESQNPSGEWDRDLFYQYLSKKRKKKKG